MDLPPCPVCGTELLQEAKGGHARCPECGFVTPVEVDGGALQALLEEAAAPLGGPALQLPSGPGTDGMRLADRRPQSMLDAPHGPPVPSLSPPSPPRELAARAPPVLEDSRGQLPKAPPDASPTPLRSELERDNERRGRQLKARGELLR